jgi:hypothetical protein
MEERFKQDEVIRQINQDDFGKRNIDNRNQLGVDSLMSQVCI